MGVVRWETSRRWGERCKRGLESAASGVIQRGGAGRENGHWGSVMGAGRRKVAIAEGRKVEGEEDRGMVADPFLVPRDVR